VVPEKGWNYHLSRMGCSARNELVWTGKLPVPVPPCSCWFLPASDAMALTIAEKQAELRQAGWKVLTCQPHVVLRLSNKASLREHAASLGLLAFLPEHYSSAETARYPAILKAAVGEYGKEIHIVNSATDVHVLCTDASITGIGTKWVLQELVLGNVEYAVSLLVVSGKILFAVGTLYEYDRKAYVWPNVEELRRALYETPEAHLAVLEAFLPEYTGICNFNFKIREDGRICVFEVNTRIGSDLACDAPRSNARELFERLDELSP